MPGAPGRPAGAERDGGQARDAGGPRARVHRARPQHLRAQELLLSRPPQGIPDLAVREPARDRRVGLVSVARPRRRHGDDRAPPYGGGRGEVAARPLPEAHRGGSEPLRRTVDRDRDRSRFPIGAGGARLPAHAQTGARVRRHLRVRHGEGQSARGRERLDPAHGGDRPRTDCLLFPDPPGPHQAAGPLHVQGVHRRAHLALARSPAGGARHLPSQRGGRDARAELDDLRRVSPRLQPGGADRPVRLAAVAGEPALQPRRHAGSQGRTPPSTRRRASRPTPTGRATGASPR